MGSRPPPLLCFLGLAGVLVLTGCATLAGLEAPPRVTLVNIQPVQIDLLEQRYLATLRIQNPNPVALPIEGIDSAITLNGSEFANGVSSQHVTVPAYGESTLEVGVTSSIMKLFDQFQRFAESEGTLRYGITGRLGVQGIPGGVPFEQDGEINLRPGTARPARAA